ncbi:MAG: hypothetical protein AAF388_29220, partial [Bacteroidota bacterium]
AYFLNENGVYNVLGNVSEMLHDVPDQAIGANWNTPSMDATLEHMLEYKGASPMVGFRPVLVLPTGMDN